jgi:protein phosphatase PTC7
MEGDTIVSGSDGLFDNIFDQEIISIISESPGVDEAGKSLTSATGVTVLHLQSF